MLKRILKMCLRQALLSMFLLSASYAENWPCWRGPRLDGTSLEKNIPTHWSVTTNLVWKTPLPGVGHASPIVWQDKIFTVAALLDAQERILLCMDGKDGEILWQRTVLASPLERKHT